jgi:hypothetical protein
MNVNKTFKLLASATLPVLMLAACGGGDLDDRLDVADPKVRFVHANPLGPSYTLYREGVAQVDVTGAGYKFAAPYFDVAEGAANWTVKTTTGSIDVATLPFDAKRGNLYTLVAVTGGLTGDVVLIDDPYNKRLTTSNARVRTLNASANAPNLDVYLTAPGADLAAATPNMAAVGYKAAVPASGGDSVEFNGGDYQLRVTPAGAKTVLFSAPVTLANNADWLLVSVPDSVVPNAIKLLVVKTDDATKTATELSSQ